jgi:hypothetical protein
LAQRWRSSRLGSERQVLYLVLVSELLQQVGGGILVVQRVVHVAPIVLAEQDVLEPGVEVVAQAHRYLVDVEAVSLGDLDQQVPDLRLGLTQPRCRDGADRVDRVVLAGEPPLLRQPLRQHGDGGLDGHGGDSPTGATSRNQ